MNKQSLQRFHSIKLLKTIQNLIRYKLSYSCSHILHHVVHQNILHKGIPSLIMKNQAFYQIFGQNARLKKCNRWGHPKVMLGAFQRYSYNLNDNDRQLRIIHSTQLAFQIFMLPLFQHTSTSEKSRILKPVKEQSCSPGYSTHMFSV